MDDYTVRIATPKDKNKLYDVLVRSFYPDMPLFAACGISSPPLIDDWPALQTLHSGYTIIAETPEHKILGAAINVAPENELVVPGPTILGQFWSYLIADTNGLIEKLENTLMELRILTVTNESRGKGVAKKLITESENMAKRRGEKSIFAMATGAYVEAAFKRNGWKCIYKLLYKDYAEINPNFKLPPYPHTQLTLYVKDLTNGTIPNITYRIAKKQEKEEIYELLVHSFVPDVPIFRAFGLVEPPKMNEWPTLKEIGDYENTILAVNDSQKIVGAAIIIFPKGEDQPQLEFLTKLDGFFKFLNSDSNGLLFKMEKTIVELRIMAVHRDFRGMGISKRLIQESEYLINRLNKGKMFAVSTGAFMEAAFLRQGWKTVYALQYDQYAKRNPEFGVPPLPHKQLAVLVKENPDQRPTDDE